MAGSVADAVTVGDVVAVGCAQPRKFGPVSSCSIGVTWPLIQTVSLPKAMTRWSVYWPMSPNCSRDGLTGALTADPTGGSCRPAAL